MRIVTLLAFCFITNATLLAADETANPAPATTAAEVSAQQLDQWVQDLNSQDFDARKTASQRLMQAGVQAVPHLAKAAETDDLEVAARVIAVLKELLTAEQEATQQAARAALEQLTKSTNRSVAARAHAAIKPPEPEQPENGVRAIAVFGGIAGGAAQQIRIQARQNNAEKEVEVEENGKKISITENPKNGITVKITETVNGAEKTTTTQAKNVEDLKKNHPEAHKLYEKYAARGNQQQIFVNGGQIQIQVAPAIPVNAVPVPLARGRLPFVPVQKVEEAAKITAEAQKKIEAATEELRKLAAAGKLDAEATAKLTEQIQAAVREIAEGQSKLLPAKE